MATIRPFRGIRPAADKAASVAALPYDVYSRKEAKEETLRHPLSFLNIDRPETQFPDDIDMYSPQVYEKAKELLDDMIGSGTFIQDDTPCFYLYAQTMNGRTQTGLVGCASIDDYLEQRIKKHENTLAAKEQDRICHIDALSAQTGPIFLAYRSNPDLQEIIRQLTAGLPLCDFTSEDLVRHQVWKISSDETIRRITGLFSGIQSLYIADGHHRAASAVKVGLKRREQFPGCLGDEEFNYFLSVLFPADELCIYDYNRVVKDLNHCTFEQFLAMISDGFEITETGTSICRPARKGEIGMYMNRTWYLLRAKTFLLSDDPVDGLDVSILQNTILNPILGIADPKTDSRISFVGGIRGLEALMQMTDQTDDGVAFAMYPTSMDELLAVADAGRLMPPKSTWFEPKLRSGLFIHQFEKGEKDNDKTHGKK